MRTIENEYPDYTAETDALDALFDGNGDIAVELPKLLKRIIDRHAGNSAYTKMMYNRYKTEKEAVPIFTRELKYKDAANPINHKINNDFFSEIVDFFVGYFGNITYSYSETEESEDETTKKGGILSKVFGGKQKAKEKAVEIAAKTLNDFVTRNSMIDKDGETKKLASICGYVGRLLYHDKEGQERVAITMPFETIALGEELTEPKYGVRYYKIKNINDETVMKVEFYNGTHCYYCEGGSQSDLTIKDIKETLFGGCPLQIIPKNLELQGDAEKVLELIDAYDRTVSDSSNEMENFANAILAFKNMKLDENDILKLKANGTIQFTSLGGTDSNLFYVTKNINDAFIEHHLDRCKNDIYRFSKTPNLSDGTFGSESGEARKFRITGIESKCNAFEAKMNTAGVYMFKLLANAWNAKRIAIDPLQCYMEFKRNFPLDITTEAQAIATLIGCGFPKKAAFAQASFVDDVDYIMDLAREEQEEGIASLTKTLPTDKDDITDDPQLNQDDPEFSQTDEE